ncbi:hypothetical protein K7J14_13490 [Treponema zuelzerae]|uniref:Uncharacterized protein n=1 Tax=Teretinema zuelzerae TaxID=156 RepID=A0AAE3JKY3_9SPIR|nr:hypothetical protein [Teretinema zuelzerae]MCD1655705.1 hypothetical protein [Teretinema zuelzerae]
MARRSSVLVRSVLKIEEKARGGSCERAAESCERAAAESCERAAAAANAYRKVASARLKVASAPGRGKPISFFFGFLCVS